MKNKALILPPKSFFRSFTLIELIVVIIIVGILAAVGISQYSKTVDKGRSAEAKTNLGTVYKLGYEYYLQNGSVTGMANADVNMGTSADQIPSACRSSHYYWYKVRTDLTTGPNYAFEAWRCTSGGKPPDGSSMRIILQGSMTGWSKWSEYWY